MQQTKPISFYFILTNALLIGTILLVPAFKTVLSSGALSAWSWEQIGIFASYSIGFYFLILLLVGFLFLSLPIVFKSRKLVLFLAFLIDLGALFYLTTDSFIFPLYHTHFNWAMVQMTIFGGGRVVSFSNEMMLEIGGLFLLLCLISFISVWAAQKITNRRVLCSTAAIFLLAFVIANGTYVWGFAHFDTKITSVYEKIPFAQPLRMNRRLAKWGLIDKEAVAKRQVVQDNRTGMNYPLHPLKCYRKDGYNILFLFVDTLRYDMLTEEIMPHTSAFAKENVRFNNHYSNGNNTRHGIFALFTGLPGQYWRKSLTSGTPAVLITALQQQEYQIGLFAGAPLDMPEFHKTIFSTIPNLRINPRGSNSVESDANAVEDFEKWQSSLKPGSRFFSFIFFDSVHAYDFPKKPEFEYFKPYLKSINQMELNNSYDPTEYFARYKNSARYSDYLIQKILDYLEKKNLLDNTIVVISSDHGDEFNDNKLNFWSHGGNFTDPQVKVPMVIHWPGKKPANVEYMTSHLDLVPTLLPEVLGCTNPTEDYSVGQNIWREAGRRNWVYSSGYSRDAFVEKDRIVLINKAGALEFLDKTYRPTSKDEMPSYLGDVLKETSRYAK